MVATIENRESSAPIDASFKNLLILLGLLLGWRIAVLYFNQTDLFFDEAQYWLWGKEPDFGYFSKPPLLGWIIGAVTRLAGSDSPFVIRLASPVLHLFSSIFIYLAATELYDKRTGFWSALTFATLPAVSLSSGLVSTDVPLLLFWSAALYAFIRLTRDITLPSAWMLAAALGLGMMSKYAMIFFALCAGLYMLFDNQPFGLKLLTSKAIIIILGFALLILWPNIQWNLNNGLITLAHTVDNANWGQMMFRPGKMMEFFGAQFGVFGPILFGALLVILWRHLRGENTQQDRMLLWFSIPIIVIITTQAFLSRAHANWAATAYPAASILVTSVFLRLGPKRLFQASYGLHLAVMIALGVGTIFAARIDLPFRADPFYRVLGWQAFADVTRDKLRTGKYGAILTNRREEAAELIYYLRDQPIPVTMWQAGTRPRNHYEMTRPFTQNTKEPVLYVSKQKPPPALLAQFRDQQFIARETVPASLKKPRQFYFYFLSGYKGRRDD